MRSPTATMELGTVLVAGMLVALAGGPARATTYNIATSADDATNNGNCTLREALRAADSNAAVDACLAGTASDSIVLPSGTYSFTDQEALTGSGSLNIQSVTLNPFDVIVDLGGAGRFLVLSGGGKYTLAGIELANGNAVVGDTRGGAIRAEDVTLTVYNFRFVSNAGGSEGGALYYVANAPARRLTMANGSFLSSQISTGTAPQALGGAAMIVISGGSGADLRDVAFTSNTVATTASHAGAGALMLSAAGAGTQASCVRCYFSGNSAASTVSSVFGGATFAQADLGASILLVDNRYTGNSASAAGLAIAVLSANAVGGASIDLDRLFVDFNLAGNPDLFLEADDAGTISLVDSQLTFGAGSGLEAYAPSGTLRLGHLTIADYAGTGASFSVLGAGQASLQNSIVALNGGSNLVVSTGVLSQTTNFVGGDPQFVDLPGGDYRLAAVSPAIDAGTEGVETFRGADLDHRSRLAGLGTDIGCYERDSLFADGFDVGDLGPWSGGTP